MEDGQNSLLQQLLTDFRVPSLYFMPKFEYNKEKAQKIIPLSLVFTAMILFNNWCLIYVSVPFYQVIIQFDFLILGFAFFNCFG